MSDDPKQWWQTLPAIIAGFATLLTALTGLLVTLHQMGVFKLADLKPQSQSPAPTPVEETAAPVVPTKPPRKPPKIETPSPTPDSVVEPTATATATATATPRRSPKFAPTPTPTPEEAPAAAPTPTATKSPRKPPVVPPITEHLALGRVTFVTDQNASVKALATYLEEKGAEVSVVSPAHPDELAVSRPDIVIVGADTGEAWERLSKTITNKLFENVKVIGFGKGGGALFSRLGLEISSLKGVHGNETRVAVQMPELLKSPLPVPAEDRAVEIYRASRSDIIGIYDGGSPAVAGFEGIARWTTQKNYWPVCRQGNYVLWGFDAPSGDMTDAGKQFFINLLVNQKARPTVPLNQTRKTSEFVKSGVISERLTKEFPRQEWPFQVKRAGHFRARLSWNPPGTPLALLLGAKEGRMRQRKDGFSPLIIDFDIAGENVGEDWRVEVVCFGDLGTKVVDYKLELVIP